MPSLYPDPLPFQPSPPEGEPADAAPLPFLIRTVRKTDLAGLSEILASSFHSQDGTWGWLYPLLRTGIYEDLRTRIQTKNKHYACLVAAHRVSSSEAEQAAKTQRSVQLHALHPAWMPSVYTTAGDDRPLGTIEITVKTPPPWQSPHTRYVYLANLAVHEEARRQGVAQQLLSTSERVALDWGFQDVYLHVLENNHTARRLYFRAGYQLMRTELNLAAWLIGRPRQLFLHKRLSKEGSKL